MLTGLKQISIVLTFLRGHNAVTTGLVACAGFFIVHLSYMGAPHLSLVQQRSLARPDYYDLTSHYH